MNQENYRFIWRTVLAGPLVFITAALVMTGAAVWMPKGAAQVDNIVIPLVLFPLIWAGLFFYACLERYLNRGYVVMGALLVSHIGLVSLHILVLSKGTQ